MNNTLVKGLGILEVLARSPVPVGITEIAARERLLKSDVHRLVQSLVDLGYVRQERSSGAYFATVRLWELGFAVMGKADIRKIAEPWMSRLLEQTRETVHLSVLDRVDAVYIHKLESPEPVRAYSEVGGRAPAHAVATGKALLANQSDKEQRDAARQLRRFTPKTIVDADEFLRELARIRAQGYAINRGEWRETVCGVAAPIYDPAGETIAAIGISGPAERVRPARMRELAKLVVEAAVAVARSLAGDEEARPRTRRLAA